MVKAIAAIVVAAVAADPAHAEPIVYAIDADRTSAEFAVGPGGLVHQRGRFGRTTGSIVVDADWHTGTIELDVDATSVDTGWSVRDAFLRSEAMFDAQHYPRVTFRSTQLTFSGSKMIGVAGNLSMHNATRLVQLKIVRLDCVVGAGATRETCEAEAGTSISRADFGMNFAPGLIGDRIELSFKVIAYAPASARDVRRP